MRETVYIETSIIGYLTARSTKNLVVAGNIETTRDWWQNRRNDFLLYISQVVLDEVAKGDTEIALKRLEIVNEMPLVELNQAEGAHTAFTNALNADPSNQVAQHYVAELTRIITEAQ